MSHTPFIGKAILLSWLLLGLACGGPLWAHGATYELEETEHSVSLRFSYSIGEVIRGGSVRVHTPDGQLWQQGQTDNAGLFSFVPDRPGNWLVDVNDGGGHQVQARISVSPDGALNAAGQQQPLPVSPTVLLTLLAASLLANVVLILGLVRKGASK